MIIQLHLDQHLLLIPFLQQEEEVEEDILVYHFLVDLVVVLDLVELLLVKPLEVLGFVDKDLLEVIL
tara:strand:+ start:169 stop:369 length:201 start_codon:yes stop_codon:yes gene_type:complete